MTRCQEFYDKVEKDGMFCGMSETGVREIEGYMEFIKEHTEFRGLNQGTVTPLIQVPDEYIRATVIKSVENIVKKHGVDAGSVLVKEVFGSKSKMKGVIEGLKENLPLKEAKQRRYYSKAEISEHAASFVNWMYDAGVEEKVIVELVVKAVVLERR